MNERIRILGERFALAALDESEWLCALREMAEMTGGSRGQLVGFVDGGVPFNRINDFTEDEIGRFVSRERGDPDINVRVRASLKDPPLVIRSEADYRTVGRGPGFDLYRDMCDAYDISAGCQTKLLEGNGRFVGLTVHRTRREGETDEAARAVFSAIVPLVRNAVKTQIAIEDQGNAILSGALEYVGLPIFICDASGEVKAHTGLATSLLSDGRFQIVDGKLSLPHSRDAAALRQALARRDREGRGAETLMIGGAGAKMPLIVDVCRLPALPSRIAFASRLLVIVRTGRRLHEAAPMILGTAFGLSGAEIEIALAIGQGESREQIAAARNTSRQTVKAQLKSIFAKLNVSREADLVAMLGETLRM
ncbi:helix-turn-helix transcriptional regulator [Sphingobium baderi]|uniref:helix-turn-helix transcriptional regulator n=1 Tax=Sphingobium baderi TaxID=1332080 RepID=UPI002B405A4F|nr:helix-turn-helix transcriptional regulator [Sphingobium baderi]WRD78788.1 helix-turn-helix transcriptional regulator [Sphingobium baderi]